MEKESTEIKLATANDVAKYFEPGHLESMLKMAEKFHAARCFGGNIQNPEQALVMMQAGFEMGMPPVEALNSLYIVKGKITIWGMAMSKRLKMRGWHIQYAENGVGNSMECTVTISKGNETYSETATVFELMNLKSQAVKFAPKEKLRWHALSRLIRFQVPEVLDAGVAYLQEEMVDYVEERKPRRAKVTDEAVESVKETKAIPKDDIETGEIVEETEENKQQEVGAHVVALKKELLARGATNLESALTILNDSLGIEHAGRWTSFDRMTEENASELLIRLLQVPQAIEQDEFHKESIDEVKEGSDLQTNIVDAVEEKEEKQQKVSFSDYSNPEKVKKLIEGLTTVREVAGILMEIKNAWNEGDMTETTFQQLEKFCDDKMQQINDGILPTKKRAKKPEKSIL